MSSNLLRLLTSLNTKDLAFFYFLTQQIIWIKSIWFYSLFGFGKVLHHSIAFFPEWAVMFDFLFHSAAHIIIGITALMYGYKLKILKATNLTLVVISAVLLHNFFYYLTYSHPDIYYSIKDFVIDSIILMTTIFAGFLIHKLKQTEKQ